ncbi:hypothetical protein CROQUDRAFT_101861 [Cronartium quercuum f. sp. fusiforme G11]|uniref:Uncharacterized protein n=1 Tax=Cronartium quercuum f. sp. fusiforme G11 TaxID=708437 RepID=A0A9P6T6B8_9BASI|nr:hypothetical protein CROQUDRAFT_101861 [Cronartium quercuum f. sp. fusiforme G11]
MVRKANQTRAPWRTEGLDSGILVSLDSGKPTAKYKVHFDGSSAAVPGALKIFGSSFFGYIPNRFQPRHARLVNRSKLVDSKSFNTKDEAWKRRQ